MLVVFCVFVIIFYIFYKHEWDCLSVGCLTFQQHDSVSHGWICLDTFLCCHTATEVADQTFYLTQSQCTDIGSSSTVTSAYKWQTPGRVATGVPIFKSPGATQLGKSPLCKWDSNPRSSTLEADALTTRLMRWSHEC